MTPVRPARWAVLPLALLALPGCSSGSTSTSASATSAASATQPATTPAGGDCVPGAATVDGVDVVQHCGPASGSFTIDGTTVKVAPGSCEVSMGAWVLNVGATVVDSTVGSDVRGGIPYLGIVAGKPATGSTEAPDLATIPASDLVVAFTGGGVADSITMGKATVEFAADGRSGTFSGPTLKGAKVTGSFDCGN